VRGVRERKSRARWFSTLLSPKKSGPRYERLGGSGELIFSVIPAAVFEPLAAHCVIG